MLRSHWKTVVCLFAFVVTGLISEADEKQPVPVSRTIKISDEPRTIAPVNFLPEKLAKKVTVDFKEWSLLEFTQWLSKQIEMPVMLDRINLNEAGISELDLVSEHAQDEPVYHLLHRVLQSLPETLAYHIDEEILYITTLTEAEEKQVTVTYNLTQYLEAGYTTVSLLDVIQNTTSGPWFDIDGVGGTIQVLGDIMLVRSTQDIQMEIKAILKALLKPGRQTFILMPTEHFEYIEKIGQRITIDVVNQPLTKAVDKIAEQTKLPIRLDRFAMEDAGISLRKPVTLKLKNIKLGIILKALITEVPTTWITKDGVIFITTETVSEEITPTAIYDVRDLCRDQEEADALSEAQMNQTSGPWFDVDGTGGSISFPKPGVMVVRQTMEVQRQIFNLLTIYRKALLSSRPKVQKKEDPNKVITHYYKMRAEMAQSLASVIPDLVDPDSWKNRDVRIYVIQSKPLIMIKKNDTNKKEASQEQTLESPQAVLLIKQTKKNHEKISEIIRRVENGDGIFGTTPFGGGQGGGGFGGQGGFGGGFFSIPEK